MCETLLSLFPVFFVTASRTSCVCVFYFAWSPHAENDVMYFFMMMIMVRMLTLSMCISVQASVLRIAAAHGRRRCPQRLRRFNYGSPPLRRCRSSSSKAVVLAAARDAWRRRSELHTVLSSRIERGADARIRV